MSGREWAGRWEGYERNPSVCAPGDVKAPRPLVVVLGAGITGLSAAHELAERGCNVIVVDSSPVPGGVAASQFCRLAKAPARGSASRPNVGPPVPAATHLAFLTAILAQRYGTSVSIQHNSQIDPNVVIEALNEHPNSPLKGLNARVQANDKGSSTTEVTGRFDSEPEPLILDNTWTRDDLNKRLWPTPKLLQVRFVAFPGTPSEADTWAEGVADPPDEFPTYTIRFDTKPAKELLPTITFGTIVQHAAPGEHGFRFFPAFYRNIFELMHRIPLSNDNEGESTTFRTVFDNLVSLEKFFVGLGDGEPPVEIARRAPKSLEELFEQMEELFRRLKFEPTDFARYQYELLKWMTASPQRRKSWAGDERVAGETDRKARKRQNMEAPEESSPVGSWWRHIRATDRYSEGFQKQLRASSMALVGMKESEIDARTYGNVAVQLILDQLGHGSRVDYSLNGPTSEAWFDHWKSYLGSIGVLFVQANVEGFNGNNPEGTLTPVFGREDASSQPFKVLNPVFSRRRPAEFTLAVSSWLRLQKAHEEGSKAGGSPKLADGAKGPPAKSGPPDTFTPTFWLSALPLSSYFAMAERIDRVTWQTETLEPIHRWIAESEYNAGAAAAQSPDEVDARSEVARLRERLDAVLSALRAQDADPDVASELRKTATALTAKIAVAKVRVGKFQGRARKQGSRDHQMVVDIPAKQPKANTGSRGAGHGAPKPTEARPAIYKPDTLKGVIPFRSMAGVQYFSRDRIHLEKGHYYFPNSPWALSAVVQTQHWFVRTNRSVQGVLSVDVSDFLTEGTFAAGGKTAAHCTESELRNEVWNQIAKGRGKGGKRFVEVPEMPYVHIDGFLKFGEDGRLIANEAPYLINLPGQWEHVRPGTITERNWRDRTNDDVTYKITNERWVLAGPHCKTWTRLATMEAANESARHAVNAILDSLRASHGDDWDKDGNWGRVPGMKWAAVPVENLEDHEIPDLLMFREVDEKLFAQGQDHLFDILKLEKVLDAAIGSRKEARAGAALEAVIRERLGMGRGWNNGPSGVMGEILGTARKYLEDWLKRR